MNPEAWLAAARTGGVPEPARERWQPLRVGVVNLWEYDDAEFWYADGRLVLRGGNGAGKTKLLELTTLLLLRGEIAPPVLDPFGSQHRTMRFNLLPTGEEDDPRPMADNGLGYAWAEYGRLTAEGTPEYLVCGLGASARRGSGTEPVKRWMFLTTRRPGPDLVLAPAAGPLDEKELRKEAGVRVYDNAARYRTDLAAELFELDPTGYDNLTELLKQLRRPKLGERLNPRELERTLRDALPRLAANEVTQLAEGWDRLEELRRSVEQMETAATAVARFTRGPWRRWAQIVVRRRSDALASATTRLDNTTKQRRRAEEKLTAARHDVKVTEGELRKSRELLGDRRAELRELIDSSAYQDAVAATERAESLRQVADREAELVEGAQTAAARLAGRLAEAAHVLTDARREHAEAAEQAAESAEHLRKAADDTGIDAEPFLRGRDLAGLRVAHAARTERLDHLTTLHRVWRDARTRADQLAQILEDRRQAVHGLEGEAQEADDAVRTAAATLEEELTTWSATLRAAPCTERDLLYWQDRIPEAAQSRSSLLTAALHDHLDAARSHLQEQRAEQRSSRTRLTERRTTLEAELERVRHTAEEPPPPPVLWTRRRRPTGDDAVGAPLWACVRPRDGLASEDLDRLEAVLAAAGLLDAWLTPNGDLVTGPDTMITIAPAVARNLTEILGPTPAGGVTADRISAVLRGIGWHPARPPETAEEIWLAADGSWRHGSLTGSAESPQPASYLGATAREQARQRTITRLEGELAQLQAELEANQRLLNDTDETLRRLAQEAEAAPSEAELVRAVAFADATHTQLDRARGKLSVVQKQHADAARERDSAWAQVASYAAEHAFPLEDLGPLRHALGELRVAIDRHNADLKLLGVRQVHVERAEQEHGKAAHDSERADGELADAHKRARHAEIAARTAYEALSTGHQDQLKRRAELDTQATELERKVEDLGERLTELRVAENSAVAVLEKHEQARRTAAAEREAAAAAWWVAADRGLVAPLGVAVPDSRAVEATLDAARTVRREIEVAADAVDQDKAWRRCFAELQKLRQVLLPNRDGTVREEEDGDLPRVVILADQSAGWVPPETADGTLAAQVLAQRERFDAEQQQVLSRLLGSAFIEHLKERLDYTESVFTRINDRLAKHPTRQGHTLRLEWQADPSDIDAGRVIEALRQGYEHMAPARQDMIREFLRRKVEQAREDALSEGVADWQDHLARALDYRSWLRIQLRYKPGPAGRWRPFDAARHGSKSGGEKVVLLSQPLFAAAVVAYDAAGPHAPRPVWLDEAMTGVDTEVKASFMGLTVELDLDVMITAHDEWCRYATVPAAAVYDLARQKHLPGVDALPHLWCGGEWVVLEETQAIRPTSTDSLQEEGTLFAS